MEFLELLEERPHTMSQERLEELFEGGIFKMSIKSYSGTPTPVPDRYFSLIEINDSLSLSVQASCGHHSTPRLKLAKEEYQTMEMSVLCNDDSVNLNDVLTLKDKELADNLKKYYEVRQGEPCYSYVPVNVIEALYQELKQWEKENASN